MNITKPVILLLITALILVLGFNGLCVDQVEPRDVHVLPELVVIEIEVVEPEPTQTPKLSAPPIEYLERVDGWTCFDYSVELNKRDSTWGIVLKSQNPKFEGYAYGDNHMVNYKILDDKSLLIHDELLKQEYIVGGWEYDSNVFDYYHFYINDEVPTRTWSENAIKPNAKVVYNAI